MAAEKRRPNMGVVPPVAPATLEATIPNNYHFVEGLPTRYKLYPEGTKIFGRPLTVKEVKLLASIGQDNFDFIVNQILNAAIKGIDIQNLVVADKLYLIFWLRANTYKNDGYSSTYTCPKCKRDNNYLFGVADLVVKELSDEFVPGEPLQLLTNEDIIVVQFPTVKEENQVNQLSNSKTAEAFDDDMLTLASMIKSINGKELSLRMKYEYVVQMNPEDYAFIYSYIQENDIGVAPVAKMNCQHADCGEEISIEIRFHEEFFLPKYNFRRNPRG